LTAPSFSAIVKLQKPKLFHDPCLRGLFLLVAYMVWRNYLLIRLGFSHLDVIAPGLR
jgi:hypothetical protein